MHICITNLGNHCSDKMACRLFSTKPLSEPMLYCLLEPYEQTSVKLKFKDFHSRKCVWTCLKNVSILSWLQCVNCSDVGACLLSLQCHSKYSSLFDGRLENLIHGAFPKMRVAFAIYQTKIGDLWPEILLPPYNFLLLRQSGPRSYWGLLLP